MKFYLFFILTFISCSCKRSLENVDKINLNTKPIFRESIDNGDIYILSKQYNIDSSMMILSYAISGGLDNPENIYSAILKENDLDGDIRPYLISKTSYDTIYWKNNDTITLYDNHRNYMAGDSKWDSLSGRVNGVVLEIVRNGKNEKLTEREIISKGTSPDGLVV